MRCSRASVLQRQAWDQSLAGRCIGSSCGHRSGCIPVPDMSTPESLSPECSHQSGLHCGLGERKEPSNDSVSLPRPGPTGWGLLLPYPQNSTSSQCSTWRQAERPALGMNGQPDTSLVSAADAGRPLAPLRGQSSGPLHPAR